MRLDSSDSVSQFFSTLVAIAAIGLLAFVGWKAFETWRSDPAVQGIQQILDQQK
ncbi:hypothetical protein [Leptolyngbya sp. KIOST-1]|uniref:hypothetical protein n=1 Tax=Leptolyngbya sp. KIOST-1 TaxID=1229172 RepID=UPI000AAFC7CC|nr:hypothetical protein [Leptolyngbya sp. KIOST-1]